MAISLRQGSHLAHQKEQTRERRKWKCIACKRWNRSYLQCLVFLHFFPFIGGRVLFCQFCPSNPISSKCKFIEKVRLKKGERIEQCGEELDCRWIFSQFWHLGHLLLCPSNFLPSSFSKYKFDIFQILCHLENIRQCTFGKLFESYHSSALLTDLFSSF